MSSIHSPGLAGNNGKNKNAIPFYDAVLIYKYVTESALTTQLYHIYDV